MALTFDDLVAGPTLPDQEVYIHALKDSVIISPVALERFEEYSKAENEVQQLELVTIVIAESVSHQSGLSIEKAKELNALVAKKMHPAAWEEIQSAVMTTMFGEDRLKKAQALAAST